MGASVSRKTQLHNKKSMNVKRHTRKRFREVVKLLRFIMCRRIMEACNAGRCRGGGVASGFQSSMGRFKAGTER